MSLSNTATLQRAIYRHLSQNSDIAQLVGSHIYDALPSGTLPQLFISLGVDDVTDASDVTGQGTLHDLVISVITTQPGFLLAKDLAGSIGQALLNTPPDLGPLGLVYLNFVRATARRDTDTQTRRIDITFRARIDTQT